MEVLKSLRDRMAELSDLGAAQMLAEWDQLVMMPRRGRRGAGAAARHAGAPEPRAGDRRRDRRVARPSSSGALLDELDRDIVRLARRDWERARHVPDELAVELAQASAAGSGELARARASRRLRGLRARAGAQRASWRERTASAWPRTGRERLRRRCSATTTSACAPTSCAACSRRSRRGSRRSSPRRERALAAPLAGGARGGAGSGGRRRCCAASASTTASWRVDVSAHPVHGLGRPARQPRDDALRRRRGRVAAELAARVRACALRAPDRPGARAHEPRHAARRCRSTSPRASCGRTTSRAVRAFAEVLAAELGDGRLRRERRRSCTRRSSASQPSLIRVSADPLTYPLHIILRFELELAMIEGDARRR